MAKVDLKIGHHTISAHPVLRERLPQEFLDPPRYYPSFIKNIERCRQHLASDRPLVVKADEEDAYYTVCPQLAVILLFHGLAAFDQMVIPAIEVDLSDHEIESMFLAKVRTAYNIREVSRDIGLSIFDTFKGFSEQQKSDQSSNKLVRFDDHVEHYNKAPKLIADESGQFSLMPSKK